MFVLILIPIVFIFGYIAIVMEDPLIILGAITFFLSGVLDNKTTTIVMI